MAKEKLTQPEHYVPNPEHILPLNAPQFEIVGFEKSDFMPIAVDGRQINLATVTPEMIAWLHERKDKLSGLHWME